MKVINVSYEIYSSTIFIIYFSRKNVQTNFCITKTSLSKGWILVAFSRKYSIQEVGSLHDELCLTWYFLNFLFRLYACGAQFSYSVLRVLQDGASLASFSIKRLDGFLFERWLEENFGPSYGSSTVHVANGDGLNGNNGWE